MAGLKLKLNVVEIIKNNETDKNKRIAYTEIVSDDSIKKEFGNRMVTFIAERTNSGKDKNNDAIKDYAPYKKSYRNSMTFKMYKRKGQQTVDLTLTGDMLSSITVSSVKNNDVILGFDNKTDDKKASYHVNGTPIMEIRDFWGATQDDQYRILKGVIKDSATDELQSVLDKGLQITGETDASGEVAYTVGVKK